MIRVAVVDDHPAVRLGLQAAIRFEPGLVAAGTASNAAEAASMLYRTRPDVVLLDYQMPDVDGLSLCHRIKGDRPAPAVLLYTAFADDTLTIPALLVSADGIVDKGASARELFEAIRVVARGGHALPPLSPPLFDAAAQAIDVDDVPIMGMLVDRVPVPEIAEALRVRPAAVRERIEGMLERLSRV